MAKNGFSSTFSALRADLSANTRKAFLRDIEGQIEDDLEIKEILEVATKEPRLLAVTFDRKKNDKKFSYPYFDLILKSLDKISGGRGIRKPANQIRVLKWRRSKQDLLIVLRFFARNDPRVQFRRAVILPFPLPPVGHKLDSTIHLK